MRALLLLAPLLLGAAPLTLDIGTDDGLFEDIGAIPAEPVNTHCLACHSAAMVTSQPPLTPAQWQATIDRMRTVFEAPIDPAEDPALLAWLEAQSARASP